MTTKTNYAEIGNGEVVTKLGKNLSAVVQKCIKAIVTKEDLKCYSVSVNDISTNGGNYLGDLKTVDIKGHGADRAKEINLFLKNMEEGIEEVSLISISDVYSRERFMYSNILPIYNKLQEEYKVPEEERFNIVRHYNVPCSDDVIIMENLSKKGFETLHRHEVISLKFGELSIAQLAKLHALSFVLKRTQPEYFEKNVKSLKTHIAVKSNWQEFVKKMCDYSIEALEGDDKLKLTDHVPTLLRRFQEYAIDNTEDAVCLCHGDFRANNILLNRTKLKMIVDDDSMPQNLQISLNKIINKENFTSYTIKSRVIPPDGGSFMGILREITIKGQTETGEKEMELFVKSMIPGAVLTIYSVPGVFENETKMYLDIFKMFNEVQEEAKVPIGERFHTNKGYAGVDTENIIMDNLAKKGFSMCERLEVMPLKFAELAIEQLARFHSMAFVIQKKRPEYFEASVKTLKQPFYYHLPDWQIFVGNMSRSGISLLDPEVQKKVEDYLPTTYEKYSKFAEDSPVKTFVHGDFRANNIMLKSQDDDITQVNFIDFQQTFYGCPMIDFAYFIVSGTDQAFRRKNLERLKHLYHDSMRKFLKHFDMDVEDWFPKKEFESMFKERLEYGLIVSLWLIPVILADKGEVPVVTEVDLGGMKVKSNRTVTNRLRGIVDDFIEWGYL